MSAAPNQPGLVASHAQYVKGAAEVSVTALSVYSQTLSDMILTVFVGDDRKRYGQRAMEVIRYLGQGAGCGCYEGGISEPRPQPARHGRA